MKAFSVILAGRAFLFPPVTTNILLSQPLQKEVRPSPTGIPRRMSGGDENNPAATFFSKEVSHVESQVVVIFWIDRINEWMRDGGGRRPFRQGRRLSVA